MKPVSTLFSFKHRKLTKCYMLFLVIIFVCLSDEFQFSRCKQWRRQGSAYTSWDVSGKDEVWQFHKTTFIFGSQSHNNFLLLIYQKINFDKNFWSPWTIRVTDYPQIQTAYRFFTRLIFDWHDSNRAFVD